MKSSDKPAARGTARYYFDAINVRVRIRLKEREKFLEDEAARDRHCHLVALKKALFGGVLDGTPHYDLAQLLVAGVTIVDTGPRSTRIMFSRMATVALWASVQSGLIESTFGPDNTGVVQIGRLLLTIRLEGGEPEVSVNYTVPEAVADAQANGELQHHREVAARVLEKIEEVGK